MFQQQHVGAGVVIGRDREPRARHAGLSKVLSQASALWIIFCPYYYLFRNLFFPQALAMYDCSKEGRQLHGVNQGNWGCT